MVAADGTARRFAAIAVCSVSAESCSSAPRRWRSNQLSPYDKVDLPTISTDNTNRVARGFKVVPYRVPTGACAAYYPETNGLVPFYSRDAQSGTPTSKAIPVRIFRSKST
jgi:hypothetical protein